MTTQLTEEQRAVVYHPRQRHARVLAVAGSGKTTTMVHRIKHLVMDHQVPPNQICVVMFNVRARKQFEEKLSSLLADVDRPRVYTFHSYAYSVIGDVVSTGLLQTMPDLWINDKQEMARRTVHTAISNLEHQGKILSDSVDPDDALVCIGLWKASLIPPERAGHRSNQAIELVYEEFERLRAERNALTFDDFVPLAVDILTCEPAIRSRYFNRYDTVIVDEYQDVNLGQETLVELVAGDRADVIVVGDDDQTIYEWRGARPEYLTARFQEVFRNKPVLDYALSNTFRFGPVIAQCAQNVITMNSSRMPKSLVAYNVAQKASIQMIHETSEQPTDVDKELASHIMALVRQTGDPQQVIVLARLFAQLSSLEAECLQQGIPYRIVGRQPFFERREITTLLDYVRLGFVVHEQITEKALGWLRSVANVPNRRISRDLLTQTAKSMPKYSVADILAYMSDDWRSPLSNNQREQVKSLLTALERIEELGSEHVGAGQLLEWLIKMLDYNRHFDNYFGQGEESEDRKKSVIAFCKFASSTGMGIRNFLEYVSQLDPTRGFPEEKLLTMTTIFRVKGEEFEYVVLPSCVEGSMPSLSSNPNVIYDKASPLAQPPTSAQIENERRLFYVAITRARRAVIIGTSSRPKLGSQGMSQGTLPSRFLEEIILDTTSDVMGALQQYVSSRQPDLSSLINQIKKHAEVEKVISSLISHYLPLQNIILPEYISYLIDETPKRPFSYQVNYDGIRSLESPDVKALNSTPNWWD